MKNIKITLLLISMILLSFFSGISINQNWSFVYQYEFIDFPEIMSNYDTAPREIPAWIVILLSHLGIILLPLFIRHKFFNKMLFWFPLMFLLGYVILQIPFFLLLIPFMLIWLITLRLAKQLK